MYHSLPRAIGLFRFPENTVTINYTQSRTDANHTEIAGYLRQLRAQFVDTHHAGKGFPDFIMRQRRTGRLVGLEVKTEDGKLSPAQIKFREEYPWFPIIEVRNGTEVVEAVIG
jgi:hypothetical protein